MSYSVTEIYKDGYMRPAVPSGKEYWLIENGSCIGYMALELTLTAEQEYAPGHVGVWVHPEYQGKGLGTKMLQRGIKECLEVGVSPVLVVTHEENWAARNMCWNAGAIMETSYLHSLGNLVRFIFIR